ncbi:MAG TPA: hypothetical protein VFB69_07995 [Candidatus Dormibacteraeota bacterium]|nr:hypothetical protein [Candidatus Dormibacteraeota bacterium]
MPVQPGFAPPPAARGGGGRTLLIVGGIALFLIVVLAVGGVLLNASLSSTYNPGKAVQAYFAAQSRGDVGYMVANANYLKGDTGTDAFFGKDGLTAMVALKENKSVSGVSVSSNEELDSSTSKVTVSMQWNGSQVSETYTLHRDTSRTHFVFYNDWKLDIPAHSISITVPNQPGALQIDGIDVPTGASSVSVIQGYHNVTMAKSDFYDESDQSANAVDGAATVAFDGKVSADALAAAAKAIDDTFAGHCDATKYSGCPGHVYHPKAGTYEIFTLPGGEVDAYSSWQFTLVGHPSAGMTLTVSTEAGKATASGNCTVKLVVDGKSSHTYSGAWTADLTYDTGAWGTDVTFDCVKRQA